MFCGGAAWVVAVWVPGREEFSINSTIVPLWMFRRSVGVGTPPGGPGREAEEFLSGGAAYGAHTIPHRQREGDVFPHHHIQL